MGGQAERKDWIVIEGESAAETSYAVDHHDPLFTEQKGDDLVQRTFASLNGGTASLLSTTRKPDGGAYQARYAFRAPAPLGGTMWVYEQGRLWASPFAWRMDGGEWQNVSIYPEMFRGAHLAEDGPTFMWCRVGRVSVDAGEHTLGIRVTEPKENGHYLLSQDRFVVVPDGASTGDYVEAYPWEPAWQKDEKELPSRRAVFIWGDEPPESPTVTGFRPWIEPYPVKTATSMGAVLVMPGGAYRVRAPYEGSEVAREFNKHGLHAFVLQYRVAPHTREEALADGQRAMRVLRSRASHWHVDPDKIAVCGFSAGAHLSGSLCMVQKAADRKSADPLEQYATTPNAAILCYPPAYHTFDVRKGMPENFPPAFIWHTVADEQVSVDNSLAIAEALRKRGIPFEMHLYPEGRHGLALSAENPHVASWFGLCCEWLEGLGWKQTGG